MTVHLPWLTPFVRTLIVEAALAPLATWVAVIVALPVPTPVTLPTPSTVAALVVSLAQAQPLDAVKT